MMPKKLLFFLCLVLATPSKGWTAQDIAIEQLAKSEAAPPAAIEQDKPILASVTYDHGWVKQGSRAGRWALTTTSLAFTGNPVFSPYLDIDLWDRLGAHDYTVSAGTYLKFKDNSFFNAAIGFGGDVLYLYRFKSQLEYQHKLLRTLYWTLGARYLNYAFHDTYIASPGLTYYFGNNDISISYSHAVTESRGEASSGILRGNILLNQRLSLYAGAAVGQRLYDIFELPAKDQFGYIVFAGFNVKVTPWLNARTGYSYATEKPGFIKRSLVIGLSAKF